MTTAYAERRHAVVHDIVFDHRREEIKDWLYHQTGQAHRMRQEILPVLAAIVIGAACGVFLVETVRQVPASHSIASIPGQAQRADYAWKGFHRVMPKFPGMEAPHARVPLNYLP